MFWTRGLSIAEEEREGDKMAEEGVEPALVTAWDPLGNPPLTLGVLLHTFPFLHFVVKLLY